MSEYQNRVQEEYQNVFGREAQQEGLDFYTNVLQQNPDFDLTSELQNSPEARVRTAYTDVLGRPVDDAGLTYYRDQVTQNPDYDINNALKQSQEYQSTSGGDTTTGGGTTTAPTVDMSGVTSAINSGFASMGDPAQYDQVQTGFNEVGSAIGQTQDQLQTGFNQTQGQLQTGFNQTQDQLAQGFAGTAKQSDMMSRFNDLQNQGSDTQSMIGAGFNATNDNLATGFNDAADRMNSGFQQTQGLMSDAQSAILGGQNDLSSDLSNVSNNLDTYYGGLAGGQEDIQGRVGNLQSDFTDFNDQYTQDTTLANQTRADIQTGVDNTGQQLGEQIGQFRGAAEANQSRLMEAVGGQSATPAPTTAAQTSNQAATSQASPVEAVRTALERNAGNMAPNIAQQFMEVAQAFDPSGNLIRSAQEPTGNLVRRDMDRAGQMRVRRSAPNGQLMADNVIDARSVFQQALNMI